MNLTDPPDVHDLTPARLDDLRTTLVDLATNDTRPTPRRTWIPVLAATTAVAAVAAAIVVVPRLASSDGQTPPTAGSVSPKPSASTQTKPTEEPVALRRVRPLVKIPAPAISVDRGAATETEARAVLERCFQGPGGPSFSRADAATATIRLARWAVKPLTYAADGSVDTRPSRQLVVSAVRKDGNATANCVDDADSPPGAQMLTGGDGGSSYGSGFRAAISGGGSAGNSSENGRWTIRSTTPFDVVPGVARVDMRLVWDGGAGPWQRTVLQGRNGFADLAATGTGAERTKPKIEVRLVDAQGYLLFHALTGLGSPIGIR